MVKNLLNSGHNVIVWNRTTEKVRDFVEAGAKEVLTPSDVIADSDITFSCVSDPQAAKDLVFGNCGVLPEINTTKVCYPEPPQCVVYNPILAWLC